MGSKETCPDKEHGVNVIIHHHHHHQLQQQQQASLLKTGFRVQGFECKSAQGAKAAAATRGGEGLRRCQGNAETGTAEDRSGTTCGRALEREKPAALISGSGKLTSQWQQDSPGDQPST
jgi:hypothetical protein